jgi:sulfur carrier protein
VDPKSARRERFRKQGSRAAGLFSRRRGGSAPDEEIASG